MMFGPLDRLLWGVTITVLVYCAIHYARQGWQRETREEKVLLYGFAIYFLCFAFVRFFFYLSSYYQIGTYIDHVFYSDTDFSSPIADQIGKLGYIAAIIGNLFFHLAYEYTIKKTKYILTIINVTILIISIFVPFELSQMIIYGYSILAAVVVILILYSLTRRSGSEFQPVATFILYGFIIATLGHTLDASFIKNLGFIPLVLPPILYVIGALLYIVPSFIDLEKLKNTNLNMVALILTIGISLLINAFVTINVGLTDVLSTISILGGILFSILLVFLIRNLVKNYYSQASDAKMDPSVNLLQTFTRPKKMTEEEVSISKERKVCLVCKGNILKQVYVCPGCESFYCNKCYVALSKMENACWACDTALDETKPVKKPEKSEETPLIDDMVHKKKEMKKG